MPDALSPSQQQAFNKYLEGENIFITGPGGCGKSYLIKRIVEDAKRKFIHQQVCTTTGCSAILLRCKARTIHSWGGLGLAQLPIEMIVKKVYKNPYCSNNWQRVELLIIDEVSMLSEKLIITLDQIARKVRGINLPFGGIQIVFSGDFFQLPPVPDNEDPQTKNFCFEAPVFEELFPPENCILMETIFRQSNPLLQKICNQIRIGKITKSTIKLIESMIYDESVSGQLVSKDLKAQEVGYTQLIPTKSNMNRINNKKLKALKQPTKKYEMKFHTDPKISQEQNDFELKYLKNNAPGRKTLELCIGAQVLHLTNIKKADSNELDLCNGSQGVVIGFDEQSSLPVVRFLHHEEYKVRIVHPHTWLSEKYTHTGVEQIPLILAWAITIHKSQGMTIEKLLIDIGSTIFAPGQTYVAISRAVNLEGLKILNFDHRKIKISKKVRAFYEKIEAAHKKVNEREQQQHITTNTTNTTNTTINTVDMPN